MTLESITKKSVEFQTLRTDNSDGSVNKQIVEALSCLKMNFKKQKFKTQCAVVVLE